MEKYIQDLDEYEVKKFLGKGACGEVYLVENKNTKKLYAAKISLDRCISKKEQIHFFAELQTFINTENPAILKFFGFNLFNFKKDPFTTLILEYLPNGDLHQLLKNCRNKNAPQGWTDTKKYINLLGIAIGMKYLHSQNIVQRDLKPQNILLDENYYPRISDFGLSKKLENLDSEALMNSAVGTLYYMAPEILKCIQYNYSVDVYSYALIAYQIITNNAI